MIFWPKSGCWKKRLLLPRSASRLGSATRCALSRRQTGARGAKLQDFEFDFHGVGDDLYVVFAEGGAAGNGGDHDQIFAGLRVVDAGGHGRGRTQYALEAERGEVVL